MGASLNKNQQFNNTQQHLPLAECLSHQRTRHDTGQSEPKTDGKFFMPQMGKLMLKDVRICWWPHSQEKAALNFPKGDRLTLYCFTTLILYPHRAGVNLGDRSKSNRGTWTESASCLQLHLNYIIIWKHNKDKSYHQLCL